jgi:hypothetical protein
MMLLTKGLGRAKPDAEDYRAAREYLSRAVRGHSSVSTEEWEKAVAKCAAATARLRRAAVRMGPPASNAQPECPRCGQTVERHDARFVDGTTWYCSCGHAWTPRPGEPGDL